MVVAERSETLSSVEAGRRVHDYARDVVRGRTVAGELLRLACQRHLDDLRDGPARGLRFDEEAAGWTVRFFPALLRHYKGEWGPIGGRPGKPIELLPWEVFVVGAIAGWMRRNPEPGHEVPWIRRFTKAYVEVAKKAGKGVLAAGCGIRFTFFDDEPGAEGYTIATKRDQAKLVWNDMDTLVEKSPALRARIRRSARALFDPDSRSKIMPLSSEEGTEEGINPHVGIVDELHRHANSNMLSMIENSFGARLQPLLMIITTAGEPGHETVWSTERRLAEHMLRGRVPNDQLFAAVYAIDDDDDPFDEGCWPKANPGLGVTPKLEEMRQRAAEAKAEPAKRNAFLRLRLNRPASSSSRFFDIAAWNDPANSEPPEEPDGADAWGGIDLGWSRDLSAFALWIPRGGRFDMVLRCWAPEAAARRRGDGLYERFRDAGLMTITDGDVRDDDVIESEIVDLAGAYNVRRVMYDRALASGLVTRLQRAGIELVSVGQGWVSISPAMKELDRLVAARRVNHGGNPLLAWMIGNTDAKADDNGNVRPIKPSGNSPDKIDGVSAFLDAIAGWILEEGVAEESEVSAYDDDQWFIEGKPRSLLA